MLINKLCGALGAKIDGIDLTKISENELEIIFDNFHQSHLLVFPNQDLTPDEQVTFTENFGPVEPHPLKTRDSIKNFPEVLILENRPGRPGAPNNYWHSDISHSQKPPAATCLQARTIPEGYGDTMFCNMVAAYENLSHGMKAMIHNLKALHSGMNTYLRNQNRNDAREIDPSEIKPPHPHPIVRTHPKTQNKSLFVNPHFTVGIENMSEEESETVLNILYETAIQHENIYRHPWKSGDVVLWDNRSIMHYAIRDYTEDMPRKMHRTTAGGEKPYL